MPANDPDDPLPEPSGDPAPCRACRGTGEVISNLGGTPGTAACPWCEGSGRRIAGHVAAGRARPERE